MWQFKFVVISENVAIIGLKLITAVSVVAISIIFVTISLSHHLENFRLLIYFFQLPTTLASHFWSPTSLLQIFSSHPHFLSCSLSLSLRSSLTHFPSSSLLLYSKPTISFPKFQTQKYYPKPQTLPKAR